MKIQYSTQQILSANAFIAITCGALVAWKHRMGQYFPPERGIPWLHAAAYAAVGAPWWIPGLFLTYAIARRTLTARFVVIFALIELAAVFLSWASVEWLMLQ